MMMDRLFNSTLENELRILLILYENRDVQSIDRICAIDFITLYSRVFEIGDYNLNGENPFMFSEFAAKRELIWEGIKDLVLRGLILPLKEDSGIKYKIEYDGEKLCRDLDSPYASKYRTIVHRVILATKELDERELIAWIEEKSSQVY